MGPRGLSSPSNDWTISLHGGYLFKGSFQRREVRVEDAQLSPGVVAGFLVLGLKTQPSVQACYSIHHDCIDNVKIY